MTLSNFIDFVRNRHNATSDTNWSDSEIRALITSRCNEALSYIGMIEDTTTASSVSGTQGYNFPTNATEIYQINYKARRLKRITFQEWEAYKNETTTISGRPTKYVIWENQYHLIPIPDTSSDTITIYYYKEHPEIDAVTQTTIDIPSVLHPHLANGVIADMYAKDLNQAMFREYEGIWRDKSIPAFLAYKANYREGGQFHVLGDSDNNHGWDVF